ncbi:hypothetical protein ACM14_14860 [Delftia sp. JD2]|jgi:hypothetical protein|nr:SEC-C metal-binding domain-containing protein [Delftia sp. JD2]OBY84620.1 hypothetical protein ACM14_14860 [Delftia sp. JD2]
MFDAARKSKEPGRNDPCPCGSNKKYKKCHGGIEVIPITHPSQLDVQLKNYDPKKTCLAPFGCLKDCKGQVIASHTVSRSGSLGAIARNSHVYSYIPSIKSLDAARGRLVPKLLGWRTASTFPGFCAHHDKHVFAALEDVEFTGSQQQCFLLSYRAIAWEYFTKLRAVSRGPLHAAMVAQMPESIRAFIAKQSYANDLGLKDITQHKTTYDAALEKEKWTECHGLLIEFNGRFPIQCAAAWAPLEDINGTKIQNLDFSPRVPQTAALLSFAANEKSYFLLSWLDYSAKVTEQLANSIRTLPTSDISGAVAALLLLTSENCHFSPDWYDGLSNEGKEWVHDLWHPAVGPKPSAVGAAGSIYVQGISVAALQWF